MNYTSIEDAPVEQPADASGEAGQSQDIKNSVSYESYQKLLDEKKKLQSRARELEAAEKKRVEEELARQGEYKKLLSQREEELSKLRQDLDERARKENDRRKLAAVLSAAGGDIDQKWFGLLPYEEVVINPDTGEVDEMSVAKAVEALKKTYPEIIRNPNAPRFPAGAPTGGAPNKISRSAWLALPKDEMKKWKLDQITD